MNYFGYLSSYKLESNSIPYIIDRNIEGYRSSSSYNNNISQLSSQYDYITDVWDEVLYYKHKQRDYPINGEILMNNILEDKLYNRQKQLKYDYNSRNSLLGLTHEDQSLVVYVSGKLKDKLVIRNSYDLRPYYHKDSKGFTVQLDSEILQLEKFGMGSFNTSSHFLARSNTQVYHLKTTEAIDHLPLNKKQGKILHNLIMIEPIQKWLIEKEISCMSGSKNISSHGFILTNNGELLTINCNQGILRWNRSTLSSSIFSPSHSINNINSFNLLSSYNQSLNLESTHHSQICYLSKEKLLFHKDLRTPEFAQPLFSTPHFINSIHVPSLNTSSISQSNQFFIGIKNMMYIMDDRFVKVPISMRPIPGSSTMIRSMSSSIEQLYSKFNMSSSSLKTDILVSGGGNSHQIFGHIYTNGGIDINNINNNSNSSNSNNSNCSNENSFNNFNKGKYYSSFLNSSLLGGMETNISWETVGFPIVDQASSKKLRGLDIIPLTSSEDKYYIPSYKIIKPGQLKTPTPNKKGLRTNSSTKSNKFSDNSKSSYDYNNNNNDSNDNNNSNSNSNSNSNVDDNDSSDEYNYHNFTQNQQLGQNDQNDYGDGYDHSDSENYNENDEKEDSTSKDRKEDLDNFNQETPILLLCQQSEVGDVYCQKISILSNNMIRSTPVQLNLPVGIRCHPFPEPSDNLDPYNSYLAEINNIVGFGLGKTILNEDTKLNTFPLSSYNFNEFVTDRELKRFSILRLKLEELISEKEILKIIDSKPDKEPVVPSHIVDIDELSDLFSQIHSNFRKKLQTESFFTLWEISKYLSTTLNITFPIENLYQILTNEINNSSSSLNDVECYSLNIPSITSLYGSSDGLRVKIIVPSNSSIKKKFNKYKMCKCHLSFDDDNNDDNYDDNDNDNINDENDIKYKHEEYDSFDTFATLKSSTRNSTSHLKCCSQETCLAPHLIVYKLKYTYWSSDIDSGNSSIRLTEKIHHFKKQELKSDVTTDIIDNLKEMWDEDM